MRWDRGEHAGRYDRRLPCLWYDAGARRCVNYDHRPRVCREFEVGGLECLAVRQAAHLGLGGALG